MSFHSVSLITNFIHLSLLAKQILTMKPTTKLLKSGLFLFLLTVICFSCKPINNTQIEQVKPAKELTKEAKILARTIEAHGGEKYNTAHYEFVFRSKTYTFKNDNSSYIYSANFTKDGNTTIDVLTNDKLTRTVNGETVELSPKQISGYTGSLNSVIYFATLPHKLQDPAVNLKYAGTQTIKDKIYDVLEITFEEEGGGSDHDDEFHYWVNQKTNLIDYLAYNYRVGKGGVRFRSAYNPRNVDGIHFQDYVNYKAELGTPLAELPKLFEAGALKKLSVIESEKIRRLK